MIKLNHEGAAKAVTPVCSWWWDYIKWNMSTECCIGNVGSGLKGPSWYLIGWISSGFDGFLALFFVSGVTLETSSLKKNFSISFWITSLLEVEAIFTGLLRLIPIHFLNDVFIFLGREDEDCKFNFFFFFFLLRGDLLFHMKEEQDKSESSNPS